MTNTSPLRTFSLLLFLVIALFYLFRLIGGRTWIHNFDAESEGGHGIMALGMMFMLAPAEPQMPNIALWNIILFATASLWFTGRLLMKQPLLAVLLQRSAGVSTFRADAIHVFMNTGMCYMFLLIRSMVFSMTPLATSLNFGFCSAFVLLTLFYCREIYKDAQPAKKDWLKCGANIAHILMSGFMVWMFLEMILMSMSMSI